MPVPLCTTALPRTLVRDHVTEFLRSAIQTGQLRPGEGLVEREVCARLGVSRTPVREALLALTAAGLVVWEPQRTPHVARADAQEPLRALQTLGVLMRGVLRHATMLRDARSTVLAMIDLTVARLEHEDHRSIDRDTASMYHSWVDVADNAVLVQRFHPVIDGLAFRLGSRRPRPEVPWRLLIDTNTALRDAVDSGARPSAIRAVERMHMLDTTPTSADHGGVQS